MPPVARLLDDIAKAINSPAGQSALGGACAASRGYQETVTLPQQTQRVVFVAPKEWSLLGRCGGLRLEQQAITIRLLRSMPNPDNEVVDREVAAAQSLRLHLEDFENESGGRVVNIFGPFVIDGDKLIHPGQASIGLVLDCDILTGSATSDPEPAEPGMLTVARNAAWDAVDNWPALDDIFQRKYRTSADFAELQLRDPSPRELPATALYWGDIEPAWKYHRAQEWPLTMRLTMWLPGDRHTQAESLAEEVYKALYQSHPVGSTVGYVEAATHFPPQRVSPLSITTVKLGRSQTINAIRVDVAFALLSFIDPYGVT